MPTHEHHSSGDAITFLKVRPREEGRLILTSSAFDHDGPIPQDFTSYGDNISPPLDWTLQLDAESFVLVVEDPDAPTETPVVHWLLWNIPGAAKGLKQRMPAGTHPSDPAGAIQGLNAHGEHAYLGPRPPAGHGVHRYHFQLFALDKALDLSPGAPLVELLNILKRDSIAAADLIGLFEAPGGQ